MSPGSLHSSWSITTNGSTVLLIVSAWGDKIIALFMSDWRMLIGQMYRAISLSSVSNWQYYYSALQKYFRDTTAA